MSRVTQPSNKIIGVLIATLGVVCFSTKSVFIKLAYAYDIDTISLLSLRMAFAFPFFITILFIRRNHIKHLQPLIIFKVLGLGLMGYYLASWLDFRGLSYISASLERLILFTYPTFVVLISRFIFNKKLNVNQVIALVITYIGIAIIVFYNDQGSMKVISEYYIGIAFVLVSALVYAAYLVIGGTLIAKVGAINFTTLAMLSATVGVLVHKGFSSEQSLFHYPAPVYEYSFIMAVMATVIPSFLISEGIKRIGASNTAIVGGIGPVSTLILAYLYLGETINIYQVGGTMLVMIGVVIITLPNSKPQKA